MEYRRATQDDLDGILALCELEGWTSYTKDRDATWRALSAPGVRTVVAVDDGKVVGFAQMQSDGVIQAHLSLIAVAPNHRRMGVGKRLVEHAFTYCGGRRVDLISDSAGEFYRSFAHKQVPGYRIYPVRTDSNS